MSTHKCWTESKVTKGVQISKIPRAAEFTKRIYWRVYCEGLQVNVTPAFQVTSCIPPLNKLFQNQVTIDRHIILVEAGETR